MTKVRKKGFPMGFAPTKLKSWCGLLNVGGVAIWYTLWWLWVVTFDLVHYWVLLGVIGSNLRSILTRIVCYYGTCRICWTWFMKKRPFIKGVSNPWRNFSMTCRIEGSNERRGAWVYDFIYNISRVKASASDDDVAWAYQKLDDEWSSLCWDLT